MTDKDALGEDRPVFRIALSMSGAISAGAYTAGVLDFLFQALAEMERAKNCREPEAAGHDVRIVSMSGASAGGITAALGAVALGYGLVFENDRNAPGGRRPVSRTAWNNQQIGCVMPSLYEAWVIKPRMVGANPWDACLLSTEDVGDGSVRSLFNCQILENIRDTVLRPPPEASEVNQYAVSKESVTTSPFHLFLTISNLEGIPYKVGSGNDAYYMVNHGDWVQFKIEGLGDHGSASSDWGGKNACAKSLKVDTLKESGGGDSDWRFLGDSALATSAFPVGLSPRTLTVTQGSYNKRLFPAPMFTGVPIDPDFPATCATQFDILNVDGGMINNDPFDFARYSLLDNWQTPYASNPRGATAKSAVIMISPFPERPQLQDGLNESSGLIKVLKALVPTLLQQVRFKLTEIAAAVQPNYASRWLIAPKRDNANNEAPSSVNIACGLLGGFGGFLDQKFREHDFQLGRRNCQKFLRDWKGEVEKDGARVPVIPLLGSASVIVQPLEWPKITRNDVEAIMLRIKDRADAVVTGLVVGEIGNCLLRCLAKIVWKIYLRQKVLEVMDKAIYADLYRRNQMA